MNPFQRIYKRKFFLALVAFAMFIILPFTPIHASNEDEVNLEFSPSDEWLDVTNMKPGDQSEETLTVKNQGKQDFSYDISPKLTSGSKELFQALRVRIVDENDAELYEGSLSGLDHTDFESRSLKKHDEENLTFAVELPETHEPQNELQGKSVRFVMRFHADGKEDGGSGSAGSGKAQESEAGGGLTTERSSQTGEEADSGMNEDEAGAYSGTIPQTGEEQYHAMIVFGIIAIISGLLIIGIRRHKKA